MCCFSFKNPYARFLSSFWVLSVFLYSYSAIFQIILKGKYSEYAPSFLLFTSFSILFTIVGFIFGQKNKSYSSKINSFNGTHNKPLISSLFVSVLILAIINIIFFKETSNLSELFTLTRYEIVTQQDTPSLIIGVLSLVIAGFLAALFSHISFNNRLNGTKKSNPYLVISNPKKLNKRKILYISIGFLLAVFSIFLLARGDRNPLLILFVPFIAAKFKIEETNPKFIFLIFLGGFVSAQLFDIIRSVSIIGFINNLSGIETNQPLKISINSLLFDGGEFLTPLKTFSTYLANNFYFDSALNYFPGYSYTLGVLFNFLQSFGLVVENQTIAGSFSQIFASKGMGIGFSHQLEAYINFRWVGTIIPYLPLGFLLGRLSAISYVKKGIFWTSIYYLLIPILVNLQRIDFAVSSKLLVYSLVGIFIYCFMNRELPYKKN